MIAFIQEKLVISEFQVDGRTVAIHPPLELYPEVSREFGETMLVVEDPVLGLVFAADSQEELRQDINSALAYLWRKHLSDELEALTLEARILHGRFLDLVSDARRGDRLLDWFLAFEVFLLIVFCWVVS